MIFDAHSHETTRDIVVIVNDSRCNSKIVDYYSCGIHPWNADLMVDDNFLKIEQKAVEKNCLAIGEIGLDKLKGPDLSLQIEVFERQIALSEKLELPVIIHCVKAWNEIAEIKKRLAPKQQWIYHGFSKVGILENVLDRGLVISVGAAVLSNSKLEEAILKIPDNRLLLETDDAPVDIFDIYKKVSEIKKIPLQTLEGIIEENFKTIFRKWQSGLSVQHC